MQRVLRTFVIIVLTVALTTLATNAVDMGGNFSETMLGSALSGLFGKQGPCGKGMALVDSAAGMFCVDVYEASAGDSCVHKNPSHAGETLANMSQAGCEPVSAPARAPWRYVSQTQAQAACAKAGKRLLSAEEWYRAALGTIDASEGWGSKDCNVAGNTGGGVGQTGSAEACRAASGAFDMVGNVWEWVDGAVVNGAYGSRELPAPGLVTEADTSGMPTKTSPTEASPAYGYDKLWTDETIAAGMMRGGYYGSKRDAGLFALHAASPPSFTGEAVGFRCASGVQ